MPILFSDPTPNLPRHRPGREYESGRLWIPGYFITDDVYHDPIGSEDSLNLGSSLNCSPYTKYIFVKPGSNYDMQEFTDWRNDNHSITTGLINAVGGFVFFLGDSSSCGGTEIKHDPSDPTQAFVRSTDAKLAFSAQQMTRGGFFLLGDRQGVGAAATQIKRIFFDCNLDFLVFAVHRKEGEINTDISIAALRHLIASIRWDVGPKVPILVLLGDENTNHHLMSESERDILFVGDVTDQDTRQKQIEMSDRYGFLGINFWPIMAFMPNTENGPTVETSMANMQSRLFHPMMIPAANSGCPFNTTRALTASEMSAARVSFSQLNMFPLAEPKVRTTSVWFWDFDTVKNNSNITAWSVLRHRLDGDSARLDFMSDMQVVFESNPEWVGHPVYNRPFAIELLLETRAGGLNFLSWSLDAQGPGNIPALHGAKDERDGWITVITPFELSPTANEFYARDVFPNDPRGVPVIPPYVNFSWLRPVTQEAIDSSQSDTVIMRGLLSVLGDVISSVIDLISDALEYIPDRLGLLSDTNSEGFRKWSAGLNQPRVVLSGNAEFGAPDNTTYQLDLSVAPFAVQIQTINFKMNGDLGFVWPARVFNVIPIAMPAVLGQFALDLTSADLDDWSDLGYDMSGRGVTPLRYTLETDIRELVEQATTLRIPEWSELKDDLDHKADFPPMLDSNDLGLVSLPGTPDTFTGRDFSNHLARIDITHPRVLRARELNFGGSGGRGGGVLTQGVLTSWPILDDREITITRGFLYEDASLYSCGGLHGGLDLVYTDGSASRATNILAAGPGIVSKRSYSPDNGPYIEITHAIPPLPSTNTFITKYLHLSAQLVQEGDIVNAGDVIGRMGGDQPGEGASEGLHLHFGIIKNGPCDKLNPCDELPTPANGIVPADCGSGMKAIIIRAFEDAIAAAGDPPTMMDDCGNVLRKSDIAWAVAEAESGFNADAQNCFQDSSLCGFPCSHTGLFQIQNPTHIDNDLAAGNITAGSITTNHAGCPGVRISTDYFVPSRNIAAAIRISHNGSWWGPWATYMPDSNGHRAYLEKLGLNQC